MMTLEAVTDTLLTCSRCVLLITSLCRRDKERDLWPYFFGDRWQWLKDCPAWDPQVEMTQAIRALQGQYHHQQLREAERSTAGQFSPMKCFVVSYVFWEKGTAAIFFCLLVQCLAWCLGMQGRNWLISTNFHKNPFVFSNFIERKQLKCSLRVKRLRVKLGHFTI